MKGDESDETNYLEIKICEVPVMSLELRQLLITLYGCVHSLIAQPLNDSDSLAGKCCDGQHSLLNYYKSPTVIYCKRRDMVMKFYDKDFENSPKEELLKAVDLPQASLHSLNDRITILECIFIHGTHYPWNIRQVITLIRKLYNLHSLGFVHGDIRYANVIFMEDNAYILDLDMAALENEPYSDTYNPNLKERHHDACENQPMKKSHDRYSLHFIITKCHLLHLSSVQEGIVQKLICDDVSLDTIALDLESAQCN